MAATMNMSSSGIYKPITYLTEDIISSLQNTAGYCYVRFEVTAVTMKNVVFWDIKTQFVHHWKHIISPLQSQLVNAV
jgi:hypothetical protein